MKSPNIVALGPPSMLKIAQRLRPIEGAPILEAIFGNKFAQCE